MDISLLSMPPRDILFLLMMFAITVIVLAPYIMFLVTLNITLNAVSPSNRKLPSRQVWLLLIPTFNIAWNFVVIPRIAQSIALECKSRNLPCPPKPTYNIGMAFAIFCCCGFIPIINIFSSVGVFICFAIYWRKVYKFKVLLTNNAHETHNT